MFRTWVKEVRTTKSYVCRARGKICRVNNLIFNPVACRSQKSKSRSKLLYDCRSVSQYVLVSSPLVTRYYFLLQLVGPGSLIYISQEQGGPALTSGTVFPLRRLLRLAGPRWRNFNTPPHGAVVFLIKPNSYHHCRIWKIVQWGDPFCRKSQEAAASLHTSK
jgi:hypothetical protein